MLIVINALQSYYFFSIFANNSRIFLYDSVIAKYLPRNMHV